METLKIKKVKYFLLIFLIFWNLVSLSAFLDLKEGRETEVIFFNVGQGDSALIKSKEGHNILIDGGRNNQVLAYLNQELPFWDRDIDLIILSHPHVDHLFGLVEVIKRYNVKKVLWNKQDADSVVFKEWKQLLKELDSSQTYRGQRIYAGEVVLDTLHPTINYNKNNNLNTNSVVSRVSAAGKTFLFTGDIYSDQEKKLITWEDQCRRENFSWCRVMNLESQILKVSHHGSASSSDYEFIKKVSPEVAFISAG
jgi:competence protein ComEC